MFREMRRMKQQCEQTEIERILRFQRSIFRALRRTAPPGFPHFAANRGSSLRTHFVLSSGLLRRCSNP